MNRFSKNVFKLLIIMLLIMPLSSCGLKTPVLPKSKLDLPYPTAIDYAINTEGVFIHNGSKEYSLYVERAEDSNKLLSAVSYKKVALIKPKHSFQDKNLANGKIYKYRFRHFYGRINTYSPSVVKTIKYYAPVKLDNIEVSLEESKTDDKICINTPNIRTVDDLEIIINSKSYGKIKAGQNKCFGDLPDLVSLINVTIIPYDFNNDPGTAYNKTIKRNIKNKIFPPQNIVVRRSKNDIVITWDKIENSTYNIYVVENNKDILYKNTDIEFIRYTTNNKNCVDFKLSSKRKNEESKKITVSACL